MNLTIKQLRVFITVAESDSLNRAVSVLHLTQPAISMKIKEMEKNVGLTLFSRDRRRLRLSPAGEYFLVYAKRLIAEFKEAENAVAQFKGLDRGVLTIGIGTTGPYFVPRLLALFHMEYPGIEVKIRVTTNREDLAELMNMGDVDFSVMARLPKHIPVKGERLIDNPYVFVCPPNHPLLAFGSLKAEALNGRDLIVREHSSGTRGEMDSYIAAHSCTPRISMQIANNETIKQSVMAGIGLGFLSLHSVALELRHGELGVLPIRDMPLLGLWNLVYLPSRVLPPAAEAFLRFIGERGRDYLVAYNDTLVSLAFPKRAQRKSRTRQLGR